MANPDRRPRLCTPYDIAARFKTKFKTRPRVLKANLSFLEYTQRLWRNLSVRVQVIGCTLEKRL